MRGFGSWLCLGLREGCGAMASAKSMGDNLFRLPCGGDFLDESFLSAEFSPCFIFLFSSSMLSKETLSCPRGDTY